MLPVYTRTGAALAASLICALSPLSALAKDGKSHVDGATTLVLKRASMASPFLKKDGTKVGLSTRVPEGDLVSFQVDDVNPVLYDLEIKGERQFLFDISGFITAMGKVQPQGETEGGNTSSAVSARSGPEGPIKNFNEAVKKFTSANKTFTEGADVAKKLGDTMFNAEFDPPATEEESFEAKVQEASRNVVVASIKSTDILGTKQTQFGAMQKALGDVRSTAQLARAFVISSTTFTEEDKVPILAGIDAMVKEAENAFDAAKPLLETVYTPADQAFRLVNSSWSRSHQSLELRENEKIVYTVKVTPKAKTLLSNATSTSRTLETRTHTVSANAHGGLGLSVSTGFLLSGLTKRAYGVKNGKIRETVRDDFSPTYGILLHAFKNDNRRITPAGSFGFNLEGGNLNFFAGPSLLFGRDKRIALTAGVAAGKITKLDGVREGQDFEGTVPTKDVYRPTWFVGISFNFKLN